MMKLSLLKQRIEELEKMGITETNIYDITPVYLEVGKRYIKAEEKPIAKIRITNIK